MSLIVKEVVKDLRPSLELKISTDEEEAFTDADFIMAQMRVGGLKMRVKDEQISLKHGCIGTGNMWSRGNGIWNENDRTNGTSDRCL